MNKMTESQLKQYREGGLNNKDARMAWSRRGGFSEGVYMHYRFYRYASSPSVAGYIGSSQRSKLRDGEVEAMLRATGMGDGAIADWLTSPSGRRMMDGVERKMNRPEFCKHIQPYLNRAPVEVAIWSHPDHNGFMSGTIKVGAHLQKIFSDIIIR